MPGLYNVYNALAAASLARALGRLAGRDSWPVCRAFPRRSAASSGSQIDERSLLVLLIKNPAGANEVVRTLVAGERAQRCCSSR